MKPSSSPAATSSPGTIRTEYPFFSFFLTCWRSDIRVFGGRPGSATRQTFLGVAPVSGGSPSGSRQCRMKIETRPVPEKSIASVSRGRFSGTSANEKPG
ncbi:MAG: hypothetical protein ACKOL0_01770 [Solirubrobacterales bacterium]